MAKCPFCDYEGSPGSVEAHISGMSDEAHVGKFGANHREDIEESEGLVQAVPPVEDRDDDPDDDPDATGGATSASAGSEGGGSAGFTLVAATVALALVVLLVSTSGPSGGDGEVADEQEEQGPTDEWGEVFE